MSGPDPHRGLTGRSRGSHKIWLSWWEKPWGYTPNSAPGRAALDFVALEAATLNLLSEDDPTEVMLRLDYRLKHLLVDEFQDTSENQMHLLCRLMAGWQAGAGRTLMVVGDPKQSIYGWRQAKPRLFMASRQGLPCGAAKPLPLTPLWLTTNFRATRTLIAWANDLFEATVMRAGTAGARFHRAEPRPGAPEGPAPYLALFANADGLPAREQEARWLARQVAQARATLGEQETIGILLFTRKHLPIYLQALYAAGLSVRVREGLKLAESRTVAHLHNLARALVRPQDDVAWAAVLRGPWGPQALTTLARIARTPGDLWPEKLRRFTAGEDDCPGDLVGAGRVPGAGPGPGGATAPGRHPDRLAPGHLRLGRGGRLGRPSGQWPMPGPTWISWPRRKPGSPKPPSSRPTSTSGGLSAAGPPGPGLQVEILTVHGAKGLEFHQVFLPFLDWQPLKSEDNTPPFLLEEIPGRAVHGLALARPYVQEKQSSLYLLAPGLEKPAGAGRGPAGPLCGGDPGPAAPGHVRRRPAG